MHLYQPQFGSDLDLPEIPVSRTILISSTPRSGSHMLGHAMAATGRLGVPFEYLNPANLARWEETLDTSGASDTLRGIMRRRTNPNGTFALKAHYSHTDMIGGPSALFGALPSLTVVHIRRADVLRQAISYAVARQTGVWIAGQEPDGREARFDADLIDECLRDIALQNARWSAAFREAGLTPVEIFYEAATRDIAGTVTRIARAAGVTGEGETLDAATATEPQSRRAETDDWVERYARARSRAPSTVARIRSRLRSGGRA